MAQLRAKQIKLVAQDDLLIGGANGNGKVLSKGNAGQVLKVLTGGQLGYEKAAAADTTLAAIDGITATDVQAAVAELHANAATLAGTVAAADAALKAELDATQTGAGLGEGGTYTADATTTYLKGATSLTDADKKLDAAIEEVARDLAALGTGSLTALQAEVDATQGSLGLEEDGTMTDFASANYILAGGTFKAAIEALDAQAKTNADAVAAEALRATGAETALGGRVNNVNTALGTTGDAYGTVTGSNYLNDSISFRSADIALDTAIKSLADQVTALGAAFNYVGTVDGGADAENAYDLNTLAAGGKDAGDYYKVTTKGWFKIGAEGEAFYANKNDGLIWNTAGKVDVIDNSNSMVLSGQNIEVTGSTDTGFTVALTGVVQVANGGTGKAALESVTTNSEMVVLGEGAANSVVNAFTIDIDTTKIDFATLDNVNAPGPLQEGMFLQWTSAGLAYVSAADIGATVNEEEDFTPVAGANAKVTLGKVPSGAIAVFINGVKLKKTGFTLSGRTVTLVDSVNGYAVDAEDTISVSYSYAA